MKKIVKNLIQKETELARCFTGMNNNNKQTKVNAYV